MSISIMKSLTIYFLCGVLHVITCASTTVRERQFSKKTGVLYQPPYSGPELMSRSGRPCTAISCARACQEEAGCVVFSHNEAKATCILSRRPDNDSANYEISHSEWNTYYTGKLQNTHQGAGRQRLLTRRNRSKENVIVGENYLPPSKEQAKKRFTERNDALHTLRT